MEPEPTHDAILPPTPTVLYPTPDYTADWQWTESSAAAARSVPVDSAALYEAVNAWVDALVMDKEQPLGIASDSALYYGRHALLNRLQVEVHDAAYTLAQTRYEQRQAARGAQS